jgi:hypothetical protein
MYDWSLTLVAIPLFVTTVVQSLPSNQSPDKLHNIIIFYLHWSQDCKEWVFSKICFWNFPLKCLLGQCEEWLISCHDWGLTWTQIVNCPALDFHCIPCHGRTCRGLQKQWKHARFTWYGRWSRVHGVGMICSRWDPFPRFKFIIL